VPREFQRVVDYGRKHQHQHLSAMKWKKTFISGNSAIVYGIELNGENFILKITKHDHVDGLHTNDMAPCVEEDDIRSLHETDNPCRHKPRHGLVRTARCSALPNLGRTNTIELFMYEPSSVC
jgi:hypothetical protein